MYYDETEVMEVRAGYQALLEEYGDKLEEVDRRTWKETTGLRGIFGKMFHKYTYEKNRSHNLNARYALGKLTDYACNADMFTKYPHFFTRKSLENVRTTCMKYTSV